jgi:hypothetical protein
MATKPSTSVSTFQQMMGAIPAPVQRKGGLSSVYTETTNAISESFGAIGELASAARQLSQQASASASMARVEGSLELLKTMNIEDVQGVEAIVLAQSLTAYIKSIR